MAIRQIDIMIDSASRPDLLKATMESIIQNLSFTDGKIRWLFHEAVLRGSDSTECVKYIEALRMFEEIVVTKNPQGEGISISNMLKRAASSYFVHFEDDHVLLRPLDLCICYDIFEKYKFVNQIAFNKRQTMRTVGSNNWLKKEVDVPPYGKLTTTHHWRFSPAIWRLSYILPRWQEFPGPNFHWEINKILQADFENGREKTADAVIELMGTFYLGPVDEHAYVKHIGYGRSGRKEDLK